MVAYEFYWLDSTGQYQVVGVLPERRKDPERVTQESIMNWGINFFAKDLIIKAMFFIQVTIDPHGSNFSADSVLCNPEGGSKVTLYSTRGVQRQVQRDSAFFC